MEGGGGAGGWQDSAVLVMIFCSKFHCRGEAAYLFLMEQLVSKHWDVYDDKESTRKREAIKSHSLRVATCVIGSVGCISREEG